MAKAHWNQYWKHHAAMTTKHIINYDSYYRLLRRLLPPPTTNTGHILDAGCGSGMRTLALLEDPQYQRFKGTLLDYSKDALKFARNNARANNNVKTVYGNLLHLPFPDNTFDIVWNEGVNEHFKNEERRQVFNEMTRVCKPGGHIVVIVPNRRNIPYRVTKLILEFSNRWPYGFERPFNIEELRRKMHNAGLSIKNQSGVKVILSFGAIFDLFSSSNHPSRITPNSPYNVKMRPFVNLVRHLDIGLENLFGAFFGKDIGVVGVKLPYNQPRTGKLS